MGWTTPSSWGNPRQKVGVLAIDNCCVLLINVNQSIKASLQIVVIYNCIYSKYLQHNTGKLYLNSSILSSDCFVAGVKARLPILGWLPQYNLNDAVSDAIAGVTVGLTVIPQGDVMICTYMTCHDLT